MDSASTGVTAFRPAGPRRRSDILGELLRIVGRTDDALPYSDVLYGVMDELGLIEEETSLDMMGACHMMILGGVIDCNTYDRATGDFELSWETTLKASPRLRRHVDGHYFAPAVDEIDEGFGED